MTGAEANEAPSAPRLKLKISDFDILRVLGDGSLSTVFHVVLKTTGEHYALKVIDKIYIHRHNMTQAVIRERHIMDKLHHDLIVRLRFTFQDEQKLYMAMDLHRAGDLFEQLQHRKPLPLDHARFYAAEMVLILQVLRAHNIVFRDFKPENLLLQSTGHLALTDFGCAKEIDPSEAFVQSTDKQSSDVATDVSNTAPDTQAAPSTDDHIQKEKRKVTFVGTADYLSPEILNNTSCSLAVDLWAFGCMVFQMISGTPPFRDKSQYLIMQKVASVEFEFPDNFPADARDLVSRLLMEDPAKRIGARDLQEVKDHPFFSGIDWQTVGTGKAPDFVELESRHNDADLWEMRALQEALPSGADGQCSTGNV